MKYFSIITPVYNAAETIHSCIESVASQNFDNYEHIIMDSVSSDNTAEIVTSFKNEKIKFISKKDKGSCDGLNKGIEIAQGEVVCFLCGDDLFEKQNVLNKVYEVFESDKSIEVVYSDIIYVDRMDINIVKRYWKSSEFKLGLYHSGWLPPHTSLFIKRSVLLKYGHFNLRFKFAADYDLSFRLLEIHKVKSKYIPDVLVRMRAGGVSNSSIKNIYKSLADCYQVLKSHGVKMPIVYIINTLFYRVNQILLALKYNKLNESR